MSSSANRCNYSGCKVKLSIAAYSCKCSGKFCPSHRPSDVHSCTYDYKNENEKNLLKYMSSPVISKKIDII